MIKSRLAETSPTKRPLSPTGKPNHAGLHTSLLQHEILRYVFIFIVDGRDCLSFHYSASSSNSSLISACSSSSSRIVSFPVQCLFATLGQRLPLSDPPRKFGIAFVADEGPAFLVGDWVVLLGGAGPVFDERFRVLEVAVESLNGGCYAGFLFWWKMGQGVSIEEGEEEETALKGDSEFGYHNRFIFIVCRTRGKC